MNDPRSKALDCALITPPPAGQRVSRGARFGAKGEKKNRYTLPERLESCSPVGYRTRVSLSEREALEVLPLLSLARPSAFAPSPALTERELFEESALGVLSSRQSTNFFGQRQVTLGPVDGEIARGLLGQLHHREAEALPGASHVHLVLARPYRTPFTLLLTLLGHRAVMSPLTVALRALDKRLRHTDDIPSVGFLHELHLGTLADGLERAAVIASDGKRRAQVFMQPFAGRTARRKNQKAIRGLEALAGLSAPERAAGWRLGLVAQVGTAIAGEEQVFSAGLSRKLGANLMAFRSERIQPGVNAEEAAPSAYRARQTMDVPDALTVQAGRAAYNAFAHWTGFDREKSKELLLLERIDVLTPTGKERLREVRQGLDEVADHIFNDIPLWADLSTGRAFSRNAKRGKKAFALAGQRIYIGGLSRPEIERAGLDWTHAIRAFGAAAARSALYAEWMGTTGIPEGCDLLAGICLMAGPVNQNDIGKTFYGKADLLEKPFAGRSPTSLLVWTLKAKTVADPIGNEEQLLNPARKGALVDLRPAPHEACAVRIGGRIEPLRRRAGRTNHERAFGDVGNFVTDPEGREIPGNRGAPWPRALAEEAVWP